MKIIYVLNIYLKIELFLYRYVITCIRDAFFRDIYIFYAKSPVTKTLV